jgi:hypothetical protein
MKEISLAEGDFKAKDALEILTAYIHVEIRLYQRKIDIENDHCKIAEYKATIHRLQKTLFDVCVFLDRENGEIHLSSKLYIS